MLKNKIKSMAECSQLDFSPLLIRTMFQKKKSKKKLHTKLSQCPGKITEFSKQGNLF